MFGEWSIGVAVGPRINDVSFEAGRAWAQVQWQADNAETCRVSFSDGVVSVTEEDLEPVGSHRFNDIHAADGGVLEVTCSGHGDEVTETREFGPIPPIVFNTMRVTPEHRDDPGLVELCWEITGARYCELRIVRADGSLEREYLPVAEGPRCASYFVDGYAHFEAACGDGGFFVDTFKGVDAASGSAVRVLTATPSRLAEPGPVTLDWVAHGATSCVLDGDGIDGTEVMPTGSLTTQLADSDTFTLTCLDADGTQFSRSLQVDIGLPISRFLLIQTDGAVFVSWDKPMRASCEIHLTNEDGGELTAFMNSSGAFFWGTPGPATGTMRCFEGDIEATVTASTETPSPIQLEVTPGVLDAPGEVAACWHIPEGMGSCDLLARPYEPGGAAGSYEWSTVISAVPPVACAAELGAPQVVESPTQYRVDCSNALSNDASAVVGPAISLRPDSVHLFAPFPIELSWTTENADTCTLLQDGAPVSEALEETGLELFLAASTELTLTCERGGMVASRTVEATVGPYAQRFDVWADGPSSISVELLVYNVPSVPPPDLGCRVDIADADSGTPYTSTDVYWSDMRSIDVGGAFEAGHAVEVTLSCQRYDLVDTVVAVRTVSPP